MMLSKSMPFFRRTLRWLYVLLVCLAAWSSTAAPAWAQGLVKQRSRYVNEYILILLIVALGIFVVMRPVDRSKEIKPKTDD